MESNQPSPNDCQVHTRIRSEHCARYLTTLCRHFSRKIEVEYNERQGVAYFPYGVCTLTLSEPDSLNIHCAAQTPEGLSAVKQVLTSHLEMFAYRGDQFAIQWTQSASE